MAKYSCSVEIVYYTALDTFGKSYENEIELSDEQAAQLKGLAREGAEWFLVDKEELKNKYPDLDAELFGQWESVGEELTLEAFREESRRVSEELGEEEVNCEYGVDLTPPIIIMTVPELRMTIGEE